MEIQGIFEEAYLSAMDVSESFEEMSAGHRASCHRCGNIRKNITKCTICPQVFCRKCCDKMVTMDGPQVFMDGCPVCKELCCCGPQKSYNCTRQFHCYKKCLRSRVSPRSRNSSPRMSAPRLGQASSSDTLHGTSERTSPMEAFLRDYTDSEDEAFLPNGGLTTIREGTQEDVVLTTQSTQNSASGAGAIPFGQTGALRAPAGLAPIDTSLGAASPSPRGTTRPRSKGSHRSAVSTPSKRAKPSEEELLSSMQIAARQACFAPQPPFNSGIPSIFAPQSLTPDVSPFFLQSALPSSNRLPSIRTLLTSELANPFSAYIPTAFQAQLPHAHFAVPEAVQTHVQRMDMSAPDPAVGYGFGFGGTAAVAAPPPAGGNAPSTTIFGAMASAAAGRVESGLPASVPGGAYPVPTVTTTATVTALAAATTGVHGVPYISTPNIDRACQYLSLREAAKKALSGSTTNSGNSSSEKESTTGSPRGTRKETAATIAPVAAPASAGADLFQRLQLSSLSPVAGLFCTPIATEGTDSQSQPHLFSSQRSNHAYLAPGSSMSYDWSGETSQHLGVDVLTPAGLPQCTPMTALDSSTQASAGLPPSFLSPDPRAVTMTVTPRLDRNPAHRTEDDSFVGALADAAYMLEQGQRLTDDLQRQHGKHHGHRTSGAQTAHVLSPPAQPSKHRAPQKGTSSSTKARTPQTKGTKQSSPEEAPAVASTRVVTRSRSKCEGKA